MGAGGSVVVPFQEREGIRGEDKYAATTFRRVDLHDEDLNKLYTIFLKILEKNPYPKHVDPESICHYFGLKDSDFVVKLFDAVDFDASDSIDFKEFTLGLWNFLSLPMFRMPALLFYVYDSLKCNLIDMMTLKSMLEATHAVKLSPLTVSLNNVLKSAHINNTKNGVDSAKFRSMCIDEPLIIKPILELQNKMRKKIVGTGFWKKLELRRTNNIRADIRDVNYVYIVNEETEVWRKKDYELGLVKDYEMDENEPTSTTTRRYVSERRRGTIRVEEDWRAQKSSEEGEKHELDEETVSRLHGVANVQMADDSMHNAEGGPTPAKVENQKDFESFAESLFMTAKGKFLLPTVPIEAVAVFEYPGKEWFILGVFVDLKKDEEKIVMVNQDLARKRMRVTDLARINKRFEGCAKLRAKLLPEQIKLRNNSSLLKLCNVESMIPDYVHYSKYCSGAWNQVLRTIVLDSINSGIGVYKLHKHNILKKNSMSAPIASADLSCFNVHNVSDNKIEELTEHNDKESSKEKSEVAKRRLLSSTKGASLRTMIVEAQENESPRVYAAASTNEIKNSPNPSRGRVKVPPLVLPKFEGVIK